MILYTPTSLKTRGSLRVLLIPLVSFVFLLLATLLTISLQSRNGSISPLPKSRDWIEEQ